MNRSAAYIAALYLKQKDRSDEQILFRNFTALTTALSVNRIKLRIKYMESHVSWYSWHMPLIIRNVFGNMNEEKYKSTS